MGGQSHQQRSVISHFVKNWLEKLKNVFYDADDLLNNFSTAALQKDLLDGNKLTKEVCLFFSSLNQFAYCLKWVEKLRPLRRD